MTFQIRAADGHVYTVHTEVGDGPARVCLDVVEPLAEPQRSLEEPGDEE